MKTTDTFILILHDLGALTFSFHLFFCNSSILKYIHPFLQFKNVYFHAVKFFRLHGYIINFFRHFAIFLMKSDSCKNILYIIQFTHNISSSHPSDTEDMMNDTTNIEKVVVCYGLSSSYLYLYMSLNISLISLYISSFFIPWFEIIYDCSSCYALKHFLMSLRSSREEDTYRGKNEKTSSC